VIERRRLPRTKVAQPVKVLAEDADVGHDCTVENLNTLGACISFDATTHELKFSVHTGLESLWSMPKPLETSAKLHGVSVSREILSIERLDKKTEMTSRYEHFQCIAAKSQ
jgi:hypothetical protein